MADNQVWELWVKISADLKNFWSQISGEMAKMDNAIKQQVGGSMNKLKQALEQNKQAFQWLATAGTAWLIAVASIGSLAVKSASDMQELRTEFDVLTWSAEKWAKLFSDIQKEASKTPFETSQLAKATSTMLAFGVAQENLLPSMRQLWDISWWNNDKFQSLALAFGQITAKGRLTWQELNQMINAGFNPLKVIADKTWKSMSELQQEMERWWISFEDVAEAMKIATSEWWQFFGLMDAKSKTFSWVMSTLRDNIWVALASLWWFSNWKIVEWWLLDILTKMVNKLNPELQKLIDWSAQNPEIARNILLISWAMAWLAVAVGAIWLVLPPVIAWLWLISAPLIAVIAVLGALALAWATDFGGIREKTQEVIDFVKPYITDWIEKVKEVIQKWLTFVKTFWQTRWEDIKNFVIDMGEKIINYIKPLLKSMMEIFSSWLAIIWEWFELFTNLIKWNRSGAWENVKNILSETLNILHSAIKWFFAVFGIDLDSIVAKVQSAFWSIAEWFKGLFADIKKFVWSVIDYISSAIEKIKWEFVTAINSIKSAVNTIKSLIWWTQDQVAWLGVRSLAWARADWWPVLGWSSYLVWERWPEIFMPKVSGTIIPDFNRLITAMQKPSQTQSYPDNRSNFNNRNITIQNQNTIDVNDLSRLLHRYL